MPRAVPRGEGSAAEPWHWTLRRKARAGARALARLLPKGGAGVTTPPLAGLADAISPGDRVRVRSAEYIRGTLDGRGTLKGCAFNSGMLQYCGREFLVVRVVSRFFDEARWRMLRGRNLVLLDGVHCDGSSLPETEGCDRMCFYFWRTEWLERIAPPAFNERRAPPGPPGSS